LKSPDWAPRISPMFVQPALLGAEGIETPTPFVIIPRD
jgi:hypothetical protein